MSHKPVALPYTILSILLTFVFFFQPYSIREWIWSWVLSIAGENKFSLFLVGSMLFQGGTFFIVNLVMGAIYYIHHPFFEQYKVQRIDWPWLGGKPLNVHHQVIESKVIDAQKEKEKIQKKREEFWKLFKKTIPVIFFNQYILAPILMSFNYPTAITMGVNGDMDKLPQWWESMYQIFCFMVIDDTMFYWFHRFLHWKRIYGYIHKQHHEYKTTIGIASEYAHPIEFILGNALPFTAGPLLFGTHLWTFWMWSIIRLGETVDGHSGYEFPWSPYRLLPFSGSSSYHDFHHSHNVGNFASFFTWWDRVNGTNKDYYDFMDKEEKNDAAELAKEAKEGKKAQ